MADVAAALAAFIPAEEDAARCYLQLAAWADSGNRHRSAKYFYRWAKTHWCRVKYLARLVVDAGGVVNYRALAEPVGDVAMNRGMLPWFAAALTLESDLLDRLQETIEAAEEESAAVEEYLESYAKETFRQVAHLRRKVANLAEAAGFPSDPPLIVLCRPCHYGHRPTVVVHSFLPSDFLLYGGGHAT